MSANTLLISTTILKERSAVHTNIDDKLVYPEIKTAQDMYIHPLLGSDLFNKIITEVGAGTIAAPYKTLLDDYIIDPLIYYTLMNLTTSVSFQMWNKGVLRKTGDNTESPSMVELLDLANQHRIKAEFYGERLSRYLKANATSTLFPEYLTNGDLDDITPEDTAFTMPIYLGDDDYKPSLDKYNCHE